MAATIMFDAIRRSEMSYGYACRPGALMFRVLNSIVLAFALLILLLAYQVRLPWSRPYRRIRSGPCY
jgi:hypothetical protein